jgi:hypothetical protein
MRITLYNYKLLLLAGIIILLTAGCSNNSTKQTGHREAYSTSGVSIDILGLIYNGPKGFRLDYFPTQAIKTANIKGCEITETDSTSSRVGRLVTFDKNGNIIKDENNYFSDWTKGTIVGSYFNYYNATNNLILMKGVERDSIMTKWIYNKNGLLSATEYYRFSRKLKPGVKGDAHSDEDFEKKRTWNLTGAQQFSCNSNKLLIVNEVGKKTTDTEIYIFTLDSLKRPQVVKKYEGDSLTETTNYLYSHDTITGRIKRKWSDGTDWLYTSRAIVDEQDRQLERIVLNNDDVEHLAMVVTYNKNGTVKTIQHGNTMQYFKYTYY